MLIKDIPLYSWFTGPQRKTLWMKTEIKFPEIKYADYTNFLLVSFPTHTAFFLPQSLMNMDAHQLTYVEAIEFLRSNVPAPPIPVIKSNETNG
jgi:hypothetical protein